MWSLNLVRPQSAGSLYEQQHQEDGDDTQPLSKMNSHVRMMPPHDVDNKQRSKQTDRQTDPLCIYRSNTCKETFHTRLHVLFSVLHMKGNITTSGTNLLALLQLQETNISR